MLKRDSHHSWSKIRWAVLGLLSLAAMTGCGRKLPTVQFNCDYRNSVWCSPGYVDQKIARVDLYDTTDTPGMTCQVWRSGGAIKVAAHAQATMSCSIDGSCHGQAITWIDSTGAAIQNVARANYLVCSYIDTNGSATYDTGEPFSGNTNFDLNSADNLIMSLDSWGTL